MSLLFLVGMPAAGKTYWGSRVAAEWNYVFTDLDTIIEQKENNTIANIFETKGEHYFRNLEKDCLQEIVANHNKSEIVACGGGTPCYENNMAYMLQNGCVVYLESDTGLLIEHLAKETANRPLLKSETNLSHYLDELFKRRKAIYQQAHFTVNTQNISLIDFNKIIEACTSQPLHQAP